jgi:hypothetical protein
MTGLFAADIPTVGARAPQLSRRLGAVHNHSFFSRPYGAERTSQIPAT